MYVQLTFEVAPEGGEALSEALEAAGALAVTLRDAGDEPLYEPPPGATPLWACTQVSGLFPADTDVQGLLDGLRQRLGAAMPDTWRLTPLAERDWARAWMADFRPLRFGTRLWICPSWHTPPDPQAVNVMLDPGLAFGTGTHPTTRLCLEWLDGRPLQGQGLLDYGCGSGILAVAAARLGAARVYAVDNDPQALQATRANAAANGVADRLCALAPDQLGAIQVDCLVANILAGPLIALAPRLIACLKPGGALALSGILVNQAEGVCAAWGPRVGLRPGAELGGWVRLQGRLQ